MEQPRRGAHQDRYNKLVFGPDDLTLDTGGQLRPQYELIPRRAGHLAVGELIIEPVLGSVRVAEASRVNEPRRAAFVRLAWSDDYGPCTATGEYSANQVFPVRMPGPADHHSIRQAIDRAERLRRDVPEDTARLIAAHLHTGPRSALYDFAVDGAIRERLFDELDDVNRHRPYTQPWVQALARYCLGREDLGPLPGWRATRGAAWSQQTSMTSQRHQAQSTSTSDRAADHGPLDQEFLRSELAGQLIDAAFMIGRAATRRMDVFASGSLVKAVHRMKLAR